MKDYEQEVISVLCEFFQESEKGYINKRADRQIAEFHLASAKAAWAAFVRDNKTLSAKADKSLFIDSFLKDQHNEYIDSLSSDHHPIIERSSTDDPTKSHNPITINQDINIIVDKSTIPYAEIVDLYHSILPMMPRVFALSAKRKGYIRQRWLSGQIKGLEEWTEYFTFVSKSRFLTGQIESRDGSKPFIADLEWITKEGNFLKIAEKKYHDVK